MKDRQISRKSEGGSIPVVSPMLHLMSMPVLVVLRYQFGYLFLRPKSIFLSLIWATALYCVYSYYEPGRWKANALVSVFAVSASLAYLFHFAVSVYSQMGKAPHDQFAGRSVFEFLGLHRRQISLWFEPILITLLALLLKLGAPANSLSTYLFLAAISLFAKESINRWFELRKVKQQTDAIDDTEETMGRVAEGREAVPLDARTVNLPSRKPRQNRSRNCKSSSDVEMGVEQCASVLRMIPPYSLEQAESNFQSLVREFHPDEVQQDAVSNEGLRKLTIARDFFRSHFREA
jgi:hypothetical protein